jgi:hypothetical protein
MILLTVLLDEPLLLLLPLPPDDEPAPGFAASGYIA